MSAFTSELSTLLQNSKKYPGFVYKYGTAGFREKADVLDSVFVRMGMLAWLRALNTKQAIGLMVTASHNPVADNGIKLVDPDGGMLAQSWEEHATALANAEDEKVLDVLDDIASSVKVDFGNKNIGGACVVLGMDTRPHSERLSSLALQSITLMLGKVMNIGVVTTPQLHHVVRHKNLGLEQFASEDGYYEKLSKAFLDLVGGGKAESKVVIDCAFGVGGLQMKKMLPYLEKKQKVIEVEIRNSPEDDVDGSKLNHNVGAEHVQKKLLVPENTVTLPQDAHVRFTSFDGDADRIIYFYQDQDGKMTLLDGDKIATLFAMFIKKQLGQLPEEISKNITIACVQTAYANGASTSFIKTSVNVEVPLAKTGVKYCHHKAVEYDVGIYFEANGHGTVLFSKRMMGILRDIDTSAFTDEQKLALRRLFLLEELINQATGDAISDFLTIEAILIMENMDLNKWNNLYRDLPSRQLKCQVQDRSVIVTNEDESRVLEPAILQQAIDKEVAKFENGRAFVRPSGTEDVVRIYAEANTSELADELAELVRKAAFEHAGGVETKKPKH